MDLPSQMSDEERGALIIEIMRFSESNHRIWGFAKPKAELASIIKAIALNISTGKCATYLSNQLNKNPPLANKIKPFLEERDKSYIK